MGGLGITIPSMQEHQSSLLVTSALQDHILLQDEAYGYEIITEQLNSKAIVRNKNKEKHSKATGDLLEHLYTRQPAEVSETSK